MSTGVFFKGNRHYRVEKEVGLEQGCEHNLDQRRGFAPISVLLSYIENKVLHPKAHVDLRQQLHRRALFQIVYTFGSIPQLRG